MNLEENLEFDFAVAPADETRLKGPLAEQLLSFREFGKATQCFETKARTFSGESIAVTTYVNEFWTADSGRPAVFMRFPIGRASSRNCPDSSSSASLSRATLSMTRSWAGAQPSSKLPTPWLQLCARSPHTPDLCQTRKTGQSRIASLLSLNDQFPEKDRASPYLDHCHAA